MPKVAEETKQQIAREVAFGIERKQIASLHGLTPSGLGTMLNTDQMKGMIEAQQEFLSARMAQSMVHFIYNLEQSAQNIVAVANDLSHKDSYKANTDILQMFKPAQQKSEAKVEINFNQDTMQIVMQELTQLGQVHKSLNPRGRLLEGESALVKAFSEEAGDNIAVPGNGADHIEGE